MEVSGTLIRQSVGSRWGDPGESFIFSRKSRAGGHQRAAVAVRRWSDESHSLYYASSPRCGGVRDAKRKDEKRIAAFGADLSRDLAALCSAGLGMKGEEVIGGEIRAEMIKSIVERLGPLRITSFIFMRKGLFVSAEAAELLLAQLNQKKANEKEMKKKKKEEKAALKARKMRGCADESSSSSSSESSDSECEESANTNEPMENLEDTRAVSLPAPVRIPECIKEQQTAETELNTKASKLDLIGGGAAVGCCGGTAAAAKTSAKIEVCLGGKCRKSGAMELLQELEKKVGIEGAVAGCKCMGKCREGPNVRVLNHSGAQEEVDLIKISKKAICIGVGLEDVGAIVSNFLREGGMDAGLLAA
ncbi:hypothetical protein KSP40_PGU003112 [Platanthera guangdongensis]|uniref:Diacylglycerol acyltransferase 3 n=1 Tax=Platanthera guangdongensis TaxID=2320717 RepID=A0ABR2N1J5_9ASPA